MAADLTMDQLGDYQLGADQFARLLEARDWAHRLLAASFDAAPGGSARNVVGSGVGVRQRQGERPEVVVRVFVRRELPAAALLPRRVAGIGVDVEQVAGFHLGAESHGSSETDTQPIAAKDPYGLHRRPVPAGVSIGPCLVDETRKGSEPETGTAGCFVRDSEGVVYVLSNNHVLAHNNRTPVGTGIAQPGLVDGGTCPEHVVAKLSKVVEVGFGRKGGTNLVDAAIAAMSADHDPRVLRDNGSLEQLGAGQPLPTLKMAVQKSGRSTGHTVGAVTELDVEAFVGDRFGMDNVICTGQFRVKAESGPFMRGGDSGSLATTVDGNHPVGLLFCSDSGEKGAAATPIAVVLAQLEKYLQRKLVIIRE